MYVVKNSTPEFPYNIDKRRRPAWQEIKTDMFPCRGGQCVINLKNKRSRSNNTEPADDQVVEIKEGSSFRILSDKVDEWSVCYYFNPLERYQDLEPLYPDFDIVFTDPTKLLFHKSPGCMHWPGGEFLKIVELEFITEDEKHTLIKIILVKY
ncbi:hypothetical protein Bpfe_004823 [Biomphalaria pfeifferi]|uniref:Uncharacterized protein n=1 Tax=Biomphalaria pfeifferi TaxID=112525 RepID=A0AAD8C3W6_BIOPF|nr:hypothetical protein Bpfe_004823 [Biomphalaria pfeifferi]